MTITEQHGHRPAARGALAAVAHERDEEQGRRSGATGKTRMMKVSAAGGAERQQGEEPEERPLGPRVRPAQRRVGRAGRPLRPEDGGQHHHDDHRQGREEGVLEHGVAQEGDARASALPRTRRRTSSGSTGWPGTGGALIPRFSTSQRWTARKSSERAGDDEDVQGEEAAQRVAADHRARPGAGGRPTGPATGTRPAIDPPTARPQ